MVSTFRFKYTQACRGEDGQDDVEFREFVKLSPDGVKAVPQVQDMCWPPGSFDRYLVAAECGLISHLAV